MLSNCYGLFYSFYDDSTFESPDLKTVSIQSAMFGKKFVQLGRFETSTFIHYTWNGSMALKYIVK